MEVFGIGSVTVLIIFGGIWLLVRRYSQGKKREGKAELSQVMNENLNKDLKDAKNVQDTINGNTDPNWLERVRKLHRRS